MKRQILKVIVGSQAHGLATPESDFDYRGVFIYPTSDILSMNAPADQTSWVEGKEDDTSWELRKFLIMATKGNPTVLECFKSPVTDIADGKTTNLGMELRELFPHVWNSKDVHNAYVGYGLNQRKKFLEGDRKAKYACAYLRSLYNGWEILTTGDFSVNMSNTEIYETLKKWKAGEFTLGEVIDLTAVWTTKIHAAFDNNPDKNTNGKPINDLLLKVRKENWL